MAKVNMTPEDIVGNIVGNKTEKVEASPKKEVKKETKTQTKSKPNAMKEPVTLSIVLDSETYQKLQYYVATEKAEGNRSASVSGLIRSLTETYVNENLK